LFQNLDVKTITANLAISHPDIATIGGMDLITIPALGLQPSDELALRKLLSLYPLEKIKTALSADMGASCTFLAGTILEGIVANPSKDVIETLLQTTMADSGITAIDLIDSIYKQLGNLQGEEPVAPAVVAEPELLGYPARPRIMSVPKPEFPRRPREVARPKKIKPFPEKEPAPVTSKVRTQKLLAEYEQRRDSYYRREQRKYDAQRQKYTEYTQRVDRYNAACDRIEVQQAEYDRLYEEESIAYEAVCRDIDVENARRLAPYEEYRERQAQYEKELISYRERIANF
jgi:hypothetical protein